MAIELRAYDIEYRARHALKGQILADFITEIKETGNSTTHSTTLVVTGEADSETWELYTDGASSSEGCGAGIRLVSQDKQEYTYALRFEFETMNNEAEYEALIAGLNLAEDMKIRSIKAFVDSQLVANQVKGEYEAKGEMIKLYLGKTKELIEQFESFDIKHIRRNQNKKADALIKEEGKNWMTPIIEYLISGILPEDENEARKIRIKAPQYKLMDGKLYKKAFLSPWLRCVGPKQVETIIFEIHEGICGLHAGPRDATKLLQNYEGCQLHANVPRLPKQDMTSVTSAWPFTKWGIDIVGPLPKAPGKVKFLIVAIDYFTKWVVAKLVATINGKAIENFVWEYIIYRFGLPQMIVSDNGKQFAEGTFTEMCQRSDIKQSFMSVYHPQGNGQVKAINKQIVKGMEKRLGCSHNGWVDELPLVLWAHRTTPKQSNGETPFSLAFGSEAVLPAEIQISTCRTTNVSEEENDTEMRINLDLMEERREIASIREAAYKQRIEKYYNKRVHPQFQSWRLCPLT
uniref:uncharacterized protein K02A2.6-like n=1 Tax=Erigeron canadensis TaxID=72917 RepID=UPI001CB9583F|nr:uncharacterized protein K02A2.6-like [Erigeron canadensis]